MRVLGSERALLRSEAGSTLNGDEEILRDRFTRQFREGLKDYFSILAGDQRSTAAQRRVKRSPASSIGRAPMLPSVPPGSHKCWNCFQRYFGEHPTSSTVEEKL